MRGFWKLNITVFLMALLFALTGNSYAGNVEVKLPTNSAFQVISGVKPLMHVGSNGKIGIGTTSPGELVHIEGPDGDMILRTTEGDESINYGSNIQGQRKNSTGAVAAGNELMAVSGDGWDGSAFTEAAAMLINVDGTVSAGIVPGRVTFRTQDTAGVRAERMRIDNNGNVGIGTTTPNAKLEVDGAIKFGPDLIFNNSNTDIFGPDTDTQYFDFMAGDEYTNFVNDAHVRVWGDRIGGHENRFVDIYHDGSTGFITTGGSASGNSANLVLQIYSGNVGIGTTNPSEKLSVAGTISSFGTSPAYDFRNASQVREWVVYENVAQDSLFIEHTKAGTNPLVIRDNDYVGIGTLTPSYRLHVNGTAAGTSWTNLSSRDFKEDIHIVGESEHPVMLAKLMDMDLNRYKYKKEYGGDDDTTKLGFIAEEMPKEVLSKDGKGVDVYELLAFTIGAMKAQQKEIETQRQYNKALEDRLAALERLLEGK